MRYFPFFLLFFLTNPLVLSAQTNNIKEDGLYACIKTTKGEIILALEYEKCPMTTGNFVGLAEGKIPNAAIGKGQPYYDGLIFHRVIANFMIQGGDPDGSGSGGPGYKFADEIHPDLKHTGPGILSMANAGPGTNGSQFFITHKATPWLDGKHTVFGHVIQGQDVVDRIEKGDKMETVTIVKVGIAANKFQGAKTFIKVRKQTQKEQKKKQKKALKELAANTKSKYPKAKPTKDGVFVQVNKQGEGKAITKGQKVEIHYTGTFLKDGKKFDSSKDSNKTLPFVVGRGQVIPGLDKGIRSFLKGGSGVIIIPWQMAYGAHGRPPVIPEKADLVFEVEVVNVTDL